MRYKSASVVKIYKLNAVSTAGSEAALVSRFNSFQLVQTIKGVRSNAIAALREVSAELIKASDQEASADRRQVFASTCVHIPTPVRLFTHA